MTSTNKARSRRDSVFGSTSSPFPPEPKAVKAVSPMEDMVETIKQDLQSLHERLARLRERLKPIMVLPPTEDETKGTTGETDLSPLEQDLQLIREGVLTERWVVDCILESIRV